MSLTVATYMVDFIPGGICIFPLVYTRKTFIIKCYEGEENSPKSFRILLYYIKNTHFTYKKIKRN